MAEGIGWIVIVTFALGALNVIDLTDDISPHVAGEKTLCIRGKAG
jgi:hypothetical protein